MLVFVEVVSPERADVGVSLMIVFTIQTFKAVRIWFILLSFWTSRVDLEVCFVVLSIVSVMFNLVRSITFCISRVLKLVYKHCISLFPAFLTLEDS